MTKKEHLLQQVDDLQQRACSSKWSRLLRNPARYLYAMLFSKVVYPRTRREIQKPARLFWGADVVVGLPASLDLYLIGGKSHDSEIRLARYLIRRLEPGDQFLDIGAHYGYFSLLAAELTGAGGKVVSCEPASATCAILTRNTAAQPTVKVLHRAVSDAVGETTFFEFPTQYSEYNTVDAGQFVAQDWFRKHPPVPVTVGTTTIDAVVDAEDLRPAVIKIDVEGAELQVLHGGTAYLTRHRPVLVMEYLEPARGNDAHRAAVAFLETLGYRAGLLDASGAVRPIGDAAAIDAYLQEAHLESDNIVFEKAASAL